MSAFIALAHTPNAIMSLDGSATVITSQNDFEHTFRSRIERNLTKFHSKYSLVDGVELPPPPHIFFVLCSLKLLGTLQTYEFYEEPPRFNSTDA
jgi:hypothetical protein